MFLHNSEKGFTLIELLLVVVIIGLMLSVIVPRAWRANIDAKYGLVRQNCSELASFGQEWAEDQILAQNESASIATVDAYFASLSDHQAGPGATAVFASGNCEWVASQTGSNWSESGSGAAPAGRLAILGREILPGAVAPPAAATANVPEATVQGYMPPEKVIRNPFNGVDVFNPPNDPASAGGGNVVVGAIGCASFLETVTATDNWHYYAFLYQGTDSTTIDITQATTFYSGQDAATLQGMRNGIFFARVRP